MGGERRDTVISVRELNLNGLSAEQQTWVNQHTVYTHGFGAVAAYGNQLTSDGLPPTGNSPCPPSARWGSDEERRLLQARVLPTTRSSGDARKGAAPQELDYPG